MFQSLQKLLKSFIAPSEPAKVEKKPAIALITYCRNDYFEKVFNSIREQQINNKPFSDYFDLYVFQDGLVDNPTAQERHGQQTITQLCQTHIAHDCFVTQAKNLGVALHFDFIERFLFHKQDRPWVAFCEDDLLLAPGYLETLVGMAASFKEDKRVAMFSCFGKTSRQPLASQEENQHSLITMGHHWGFGMHQSAWRLRQPLVDEYLKLVQDIPYRERPHLRIQQWQTFCGFIPSATSQDYAKSCAMAALGTVKVTSYANFGKYIGEYGLHSTPELYAQGGFASSNIFPRAITQPYQLDQDAYTKLLKEQRAFVLNDHENFNQEDFARRLEIGAFSPTNSDQWQQNATSEADVVAAYKLFLGRLPETKKVIQDRVGISPERLLVAFMTSQEFRTRKQFSPMILALAKEIIEENKKTTKN